MAGRFVSRGWTPRRRPAAGVAARIPPGQHVEEAFPVLTAGPTPDVTAQDWRLRVTGLVRAEQEWSLAQLAELTPAEYRGDIHCVTTWTNLDTQFAGVSVQSLLDIAGVQRGAAFLLATSYGGYTTNLPLDDVRDGRAYVVWEYDGAPLPREHGGPARLLVPHLYLWKSAKWVHELRLLDHDERGFWENGGYHDRGDPWQEQRFQGD